MDAPSTSEQASRAALRVRIASLSTSAMMAAALRASLQALSYDASVSEAAFGNVVSDLVSPRNGDIDVMVVILDERGLPSRDWRTSAEAARSSYDAWVADLVEAMEGYARNDGTYLLVNSVPQPVLPSVGHLDDVHPDGQSFRIAQLNRRLRELAATRGNIDLIESDVAFAELAPSKRTDPKLWLYGRIPFSAAADAALASSIASAIHERSRPRPKVLALDLDDTLWRGVYGECGALGVECGDDFPGNAFKALQEECLRLKSQGVLLAILSKNDPAVLEVLDKHPGMRLRRSDFVAWRINWRPKADNARELASELDLGLDTFLFLDDSPHEREAMRRLAAPVQVLELPADPALRPAALRAYRPLWPRSLTEEDSTRTEKYVARTGAQAARAKVSSLAEYLQSLSQELIVEAVSDSGIGRIAQMHERTNQFNLTTRRLSQADVRAMMAAPERHLVLQGRVADRFGDHGVVICATARMEAGRARLISFLMSCRVIGREIEFAFLGALIDALVARGIDRLEARFLPTERNGPAADFLEKAGLVRISEHDAEGDYWLWNSPASPVPRSMVVQTRV